jgi:hypothetical protein
MMMLGNTILTPFISATVTEVHRNLAATLKLCGPAILVPGQDSTSSTPLEQITALLILLLKRQHPCQRDDEEDDELPQEETAEYDWLVIETALEVLAGLGTALGEQSGELWKIFQTPILKFCSSQERFERSAAVGTMADCIESMGSACTQYTPKLMATLLKRLSDEDPETKSNAAFGTGLLCLNSDDAKEVLGNYNTILGKLEPLLSPSSSTSGNSDAEAQARLLDNAAGCLARMIKKSPQNVPLAEVLPRLVEILPLKEDFRENEPVFEMIVALYQAENPVIQGLTGQLMPVFEKVMGPPEDQLSDATKAKVTELVKYIQSKQG